MAKLKSSLLLLMAMVVASMEFEGSTAREYFVGESKGWTVPQNPGFYVRWSLFHIFKINDVLVFNFTNGVYNVAEVTQEAYTNCDGQNPISLQTTSPARFTITNAANHYYICTIGQNCMHSQKLAIKVSTADNNSSAMSLH
ncbi:umecyanin [Lactuca sativa]|uniref:umecyanin n=1 Tax=Lactuca sativa TaxID=4236 RepID=UPI000CB19EF4|nr:umecyanin [Lactuca sativa]